MKDTKVAIIGCGNIGLSLLQGFQEDNQFPAENITITRRNIQELAYLEGQGLSITKDNIRAARESNLIVIAVKPYNFNNVLEEIKDHLDPQKHIVLWRGTGTRRLMKGMDEAQVVRYINLSVDEIMKNFPVTGK